MCLKHVAPNLENVYKADAFPSVKQMFCSYCHSLFFGYNRFNILFQIMPTVINNTVYNKPSSKLGFKCYKTH